MQTKAKNWQGKRLDKQFYELLGELLDAHFDEEIYEQAKLGVPHSKSKLSWPNQIHLASWNLPDF